MTGQMSKANPCRRNPVGRALDRLFTHWVRLVRGYRPKALLFHRIVDPSDRQVWGPGLPRDAFAGLLDHLAEKSYRVVPLEGLANAVRLAAARTDERLVGLSFDDGVSDVYERAWPLLRERGMTATVFVTTSLIGRSGPPAPWTEADGAVRGMDAGQLRALAADGAEIGSHGVNHYALTRLSDDALAAELRDSRAALEDILGRRIKSVSYPHGACDGRVLRAAREAGYRTGWTCVRAPLTPGADPLALPRYSVPDSGRTRADIETLLLDGELARRVRAWVSRQSTAEAPR